MTPAGNLPIERSRTPLVQFVSAALDQIGKTGNSSLLTFWGSKGIGKTEILKRIMNEPGIAERATAFEILDLELLSLEQVKEAIQSNLAKATKDKAVLVRLDNLDALLRVGDSHSFFDFESETILPALEQKNVLLLASSQIEITQWREYEVRIRQENHRVPPMALDEVAGIVHNKDLPAEKVFQLTLGQPQAAAWLRDHPDLSAEKLADRAHRFFLEGLPDKAREIADVLCLLPVFNPYLLHRILYTGNAPESETQYVVYLEHIREFIRHGIVYWDINLGAYRFSDSAVRRLLARRVRNRDLKLFERVQSVSAGYYQAEARHPGYLHLHLVSAIYHTAMAEPTRTPQEAGKTCLEWVKANRSSWMSARREEVLEAWKSGAGEPAVSQEIQDAIGVKYINSITQQLETIWQAPEADL